MKLIANFSGQDPKKQKMSREQLIGLIQSDAKFLDEREDITEYVRSLKAGEGLDEKPSATATALQGREADRENSSGHRPEARPDAERFQAFVDGILQRMIFDGEQLTDLLEPLDLGWRARTREGTRPDGRPRSRS
jgi:type I restriction enzyme R subunit